MAMLHYYRKPALSGTKKASLLLAVRKSVFSGIKDIETEHCFNIETTAPLTGAELDTLGWLLAETFEADNYSPSTFLA
ncbi:MAG TPA: hypothetical protein VIU29_05835, partial [Candidatus Deferrimicrobiaceae bacterium]